jgi:Ca-activated chloride channel homolog
MSNSQNRRGAVLVLMSVLLSVIIRVAGFAINLAYKESVRTVIQIASDAGSRAACREFSHSGDVAIAKEKAVDVVAANSIAGEK